LSQPGREELKRKLSLKKDPAESIVPDRADFGGDTLSAMTI